MTREAQLAALLARVVDHFERTTLREFPLPPLVAEAKALLAEIEGSMMRTFQVRLERTIHTYRTASFEVEALDETAAMSAIEAVAASGGLTWWQEPEQHEGNIEVVIDDKVVATWDD